jgi:rifampicin phosphotransferase
MTIAWFHEVDLGDISLVGGKGANLGKMVRAGLPVPPGFCVTTDAYKQFISEMGLWPEMQRLLVTLPAREAGERIRQMIEKAQIPGSISRSVKEAYSKLNGGLAPVAVRSSATAEDLADASFAGQQGSYLGIRGNEKLSLHIQRCWASLWTERAITYRERNHFPHEQVSLSVVVQEMVVADLAGVLFTINPVTNQRDEMLINASYGLGESVVSGRVTPDTFRVARKSFRILEQTRGTKSTRIDMSNGGTTESGTTQTERERLCLNDSALRRLYTLGEQVEKYYGTPQDIEWAIANEHLYLLQTRPVTSLAVNKIINRKNPMHKNQQDPFVWNDSLSGDFLWTKTNLGEAFSEPMTPLTWSVARFTFKDLVYLPGYSMLGNIGGWPYFNFSSLATALHILGMSRKQTIKTMEELLNIRLPAGVEVPLIPYPRWKFIPVLRNIFQYFSRINRATKTAPVYLSGTKKWFTQCSEKLEHEQTLPGLLNIWQADIQEYLSRGFWVVLSTANESSDYTSKLRRKLMRLVGPEDANTLLTNLSVDKELLASLGPVLGISKVVRGEMSREMYLEQYGHRGTQEFELAAPRPVEKPGWLERELIRFQKEPVDVNSMMGTQKETYAAAWGRFVATYPGKAKSMQLKLQENARRARLREQVRSEYVRDRWLVRLFALRVGVVTGLGNDIFFLTLEELLKVLLGDNAALSNIAMRKAMHQQLMDLPPYPTIIRGSFEPFEWAADPNRRSDVYDEHPLVADQELKLITGSPGSAGKVEGNVRVIESPADGDNLQTGEILVAVQTDIAWTLLFPRAAAVITDVGAALSHAAIVARELGIPAVVGCGNATTRLKTGDRVRVDGTKGMVEII